MHACCRLIANPKWTHYQPRAPRHQGFTPWSEHLGAHLPNDGTSAHLRNILQINGQIGDLFQPYSDQVVDLLLHEDEVLDVNIICASIMFCSVANHTGHDNFEKSWMGEIWKALHEAVGSVFSSALSENQADARAKNTNRGGDHSLAGVGATVRHAPLGAEKAAWVSQRNANLGAFKAGGAHDLTPS